MDHTQITPSQISTTGASSGNVLAYNGTIWAPASASAGTVTGTGTTGRITQWNSGAGGILEDSTLIKSGAGVLTLSAGSAYTLTIAGTSSINGTNTGDQDLSGYVPTTRTVNSHALSANVTVTAGDVGLGSVENTALSTWAGSANLITLGTIGTGTWQGSVIGSTYGGTGINNAGRTLTVNTNSGTLAFSSAALTLTIAAAASVSGTNTGDQDLSGYVPTTRQVISGAGLTGGAALSGDVTLVVGAGAGITVNADDVALTTPGTLTVSSSNSATGNHTHSITSSSNPGAASSLLATNGSGSLFISGVIQAGLVSSFNTELAAFYTGSSGTLTGISAGVKTNDATSQAVGILTGNTLIAGAYTLNTSIALVIDDAVKGAGTTLTNNYGIYINDLAAGATSNYAIYCAGNGKIFISDTTASTSASTGSLVVTGGTGIGGKLSVGNSINLNANSGSLPSAPTGTVMQIANVDSTATRVTLDAGASNNSITFRRANTSLASPSALAADDSIGSLTAFGYGSTGYTSTARAYVNLVSSQTWTDSNQGTYIQFAVTPNNSTTIGVILQLGASNTAQTIGFFGTSPAVKQTSGANLTNNVTSGGTTDQVDTWTSLTTYSTDAAAIRNAVYQLARKVKQLNDGLRTYGLFT